MIHLLLMTAYAEFAILTLGGAILMLMTNLQDRFRGCLTAGAAGDALGYPVEFQHLSNIRKHYGDAGITSYSLFANFKNAIVTDDTQMTMFTASGLLACANTGRPGSEAAYIRHAYLAWLFTQEHTCQPHPFTGTGYSSMPEIPEEFADIALMNIPWLFARRAPGNTCLSALKDGGFGTFFTPANDSKGCGGIMRTAPAGLYAKSPEDAFRIGAEAAVITHGHPLGYLPAGMLSYFVHQAAFTDLPFTEIAEHAASHMTGFARQYCVSEAHIRRLASLSDHAVLLSQKDRPDTDAIAQLGEGWIGEEAYAIALYCVLKYPKNIENCLIAAVNHDGDSDSTGAIAGNMLGARLGFSAIPEKFTADLEGVPDITAMADALCALHQANA